MFFSTLEHAALRTQRLQARSPSTMRKLFWCLSSADDGVALGLELIKDVRQDQTVSAGSLHEASTMLSDVLQCAGARCIAKTAFTSSLSKDNERFLVPLVRRLVRGSRRGAH